MAVTTPTLELDSDAHVQPESQWQLVWRRFLRHRLAVVCLGILFVIFLASVFAPLIAPFDPRDQTVGNDFLPPLTYNAEAEQMHWLGTDNIGRDYFSRILYASRVSLTVAISAQLISTVIGLTLGLTAGYFGGWFDTIITRFTEFVATFPTLVILLIMATLLISRADEIPIPDFMLQIAQWITAVPEREAQTVAMVILTLGLLFWPGTARLMRGMVFSVREQPYIESARSLGASNLRILGQHIFPNAYPPLIVDFTLGLNALLVLESSLSFLGFGIQDPTPTWGNMLAAAQGFMFQHPWVPLIPGIPILLASLAINYVGDGLRDALDPRQKL